MGTNRFLERNTEKGKIEMEQRRKKKKNKNTLERMTKETEPWKQN